MPLWPASIHIFVFVYKAPQICHCLIWDFLEMTNGLFSKMIEISVSAVASGWFLAISRSFFSSKAVRIGPGRQKLMYIFYFQTVVLKKFVCQLCVAPKSHKHTSFAVYFDTNYRWKLYILQFVGKRGKHGSRQKSWQTYPPPSHRGLYKVACGWFGLCDTYIMYQNIYPKTHTKHRNAFPRILCF